MNTYAGQQITFSSTTIAAILEAIDDAEQSHQIDAPSAFALRRGVVRGLRNDVGAVPRSPHMVDAAHWLREAVNFMIGSNDHAAGGENIYPRSDEAVMGAISTYRAKTELFAQA